MVMNKPDTTDLINDMISSRFESWAQTQQKIHEDYHVKLLQAVESQIKVTVNGKIDAIKKQLDSIDARIQPFEDTRNWFVKTKEGSSWLAGFITPLAIIGGTLMWLFRKI